LPNPSYLGRMLKVVWGIVGELAITTKGWPLFQVENYIRWAIVGVKVGGKGFSRVESNTTKSGIFLKGAVGDTSQDIFHLVLLWGTISSWNLSYLRESLALLLVSLHSRGARVQNVDWLIVESPIRLKEPYNIWRIWFIAHQTWLSALSTPTKYGI